MTQPSRTTESMSRDNEAIRGIMHQIRELTVPDRATLAVGLVGHLATMMNGRQMEKLLAELTTEAERVQDVPPARRRERDDEDVARGGRRERGDADAEAETRMASGRAAVGQAGRGPITERSGKML